MPEGSPTAAAPRTVPWRGLVPGAVALAAFLPWLVMVLRGEALVFSDYSLYYHPLKAFSMGELLQGRLPGWNPWIHMGIPHLANPTLGTFYPLGVLLLPGDFTTALDLWLGLHGALAALFTFRFVRRLDPSGGAAPAALAALAFGLGGPLLSYSSNPFYLLSWTWLPFVLDCGLRMARTGGRTVPWILAAGSGLAMQFLAGDPQATMLTALLLAGQQVVMGRGLPRLALRIVVPVLLLAGLTAMQWIPTLELLGSSARAGGVDAGEGLIWSFPPVRLITLVFPTFFGSYFPDNSFWGYDLAYEKNQFQFWFVSIYVGVAPLLLASAGSWCGGTGGPPSWPGPRRCSWCCPVGSISRGWGRSCAMCPRFISSVIPRSTSSRRSSVCPRSVPWAWRTWCDGGLAGGT